MKKAVVGILNRVPVVLIVIGEALVIYLATAVAKLAFTQLDPLYSVWYRVGFMAVLLLLWRRPWNKAKRAQLFHRDARSWGLVVLLGCSLVLMNTLFLCGHQQYGYGHCRVYRIFGTAFGGGDYRQKLARAGRYRYRGGRCGAVSWHIIGQSVRQWHVLYGLIAILIGGSMWGMYIITGRRVAAGAIRWIICASP